MKIPFEKKYREKYVKLVEKIFDSNFLSEGSMVKTFEDKFSQFVDIPSIAVTNGGSALFAMYEYIGVSGSEVIVPANTFWATSAAAKKAGAKVVYADCNKEDLCLSFNDLQKKVTQNTKAIVVVHIGGHIAFEIEKIAAFCKENNIHLIEDCAHAHGAKFNNKTAGSWGLGGAYSFYATKTMPLGEGGMICSNDNSFLEWLKYYRNYGKKVSNGEVSYHISNGFNFRMNEVTAALGIVQIERLPEILSWKHHLAKKFDDIFDNRIKFPVGMESGYYKYIVFDYNLNEQTGKVFNTTDFGNEIDQMKAGNENDQVKVDLKNSYWIAEHHKCVPIWYGWNGSELSVDELKNRLISKF